MLRDIYGYDITSTHEQGKSGRGIEDQKVLSHAVANERAVITQNWKDFEHLHAMGGKHFGIVLCEVDADIARQAKNVHGALDPHESFHGELIKARLKRWIRTVNGPVMPKEADNPNHTLFPGFTAVFGATLPPDPVVFLPVAPEDIHKALYQADRYQVIHQTVSIYADPIVEFVRRDSDTTIDL